MKAVKLFIYIAVALAVMMWLHEGRTQELVVERRVQAGDTLYNVVGSAAIKYNDPREIWEIIYQTKKLNGKTTSHVYPGELLRIPLQAKK